MLNFEKANLGATTAKPSKADLPKAQLWLNIGYTVEVRNEAGEPEPKFISLPVGIPVDTQEPINIKGSNQAWIQMQSARNNLLEQILEHAKSMKPGDAEIVNLQIQLRRVNEDAVAADNETNPYVAKLTF